MEIFITIIGLFGIPALYIGIRNFLFKQNIEFHNILQSFPLISENEIDNGVKKIENKFYNQKSISQEFTDFVESKKGDLDEFLAKLEKFDETKLKFKKKEINSFIKNIKRILTSKSANIKIKQIFDLKTNEITNKIESKSFKWSAFNYVLIKDILNDKENVNKLYFCKFFGF